MTDVTADLARRFARALEQLRVSHELQYVSTRPLPEPDHSAIPVIPVIDDVHDAAPEAHASTSASQPEPSAPRSPMVPPSSRVAASSEASPREPDLFTPAPEPAPPAPEPVLDEQDQARRRSLREAAQRWTPAEKLEYLRVHNVGDCQRCPLARTRNRIVFGVGAAQADVMFVGEAPGADEDRQGEPFVGRAGQLLNQWLVQLGLSREDVYIANVLKCRPPGNRDPRPEEVDRCSPFLQAQIRAIEPKVIVALGRHAGMLLSGREEMTLRAMRQGRLYYDAGVAKGDAGAAKGDAGAAKDPASARVLIPLVVTYHPAYVLRQEGDGPSPTTGRASATDMVMTDLRRALAIARGNL